MGYDRRCCDDLGTCADHENSSPCSRRRLEQVDIKAANVPRRMRPYSRGCCRTLGGSRGHARLAFEVVWEFRGYTRSLKRCAIGGPHMERPCSQLSSVARSDVVRPVGGWRKHAFATVVEPNGDVRMNGLGHIGPLRVTYGNPRCQHLAPGCRTMGIVRIPVIRQMGSTLYNMPRPFAHSRCV